MQQRGLSLDTLHLDETDKVIGTQVLVCVGKQRYKEEE